MHDFNGNSRTATPRPADKVIERLTWIIQPAPIASIFH